ncbi:ATPase [Sneathia vaginalis]|uniref:ATPase n=1 Tax=Sneathia vaginalis TaxID=187101 RepID=A0A0E3UUY8_9FUSO|nr:AAA family ATPase [Sneathia vaginalis]AKC95803.1 ATPase [Sneathia vaginalis]
MFKRKIYDKLLAWKNECKGSRALLIEGARRVGKSTIVREFAKKEYKSYIFIDFSIAPQEIINLFNDITNLSYIFLKLQLQYNVSLFERESLIVFDEVQFCPTARQAIKHLVADGRYDYIETGSLISIKKNVKDILIPSEEKKINMYPLDYEEFLWAIGDNVTAKLLKEVFDKKISLGNLQHRNQMRKFRLYMLVGGMPQAINEYINTNNLKMVDDVKREIINLYSDDFYKIDNSGKVSSIYEAIPSELNRHSTGFKISSVITGSKESALNELYELIQSKTVLPAYNVNDPNTGLSSMYNKDNFKLYLSDVGLLVTLMFKDREFTSNDIYLKLLSDKLNVNLGIFYENVIAQTLVTNGHKLYYHTMYNEVQKRNYEVDFLISDGKKISPIEVKSSSYKAHKSLDIFCEKYSNRIKNRYVIYPKDLEVKDNVIYLPTYLAMFL